jgi:hypothetical protein
MQAPGAKHRRVLVCCGKAPHVHYTCVQAWRDSCTNAVAMVCILLKQKVQDIRIRSCFQHRCVWTEYDELMLGMLDEDSLHAQCVQIKLRCTYGRGVGWSRKVSTVIVRAVSTALQTHIATQNTGAVRHQCAPDIGCWCVSVIIRTLQCRVIEVLTAPTGHVVTIPNTYVTVPARHSILKTACLHELFNSSFVYFHDPRQHRCVIAFVPFCWPRHTWLDMCVAVAMSQHPRLSREVSTVSLGTLGVDILRYIVCELLDHRA